MKKDNFDLRSYLIENKMTENSRGDVRHQLGKTVLDTRILAEMQIPADPDQLEEGDPYDHHDPDYDEDWASKQDAPDDIFAEGANSSYPKAQQWLSQHPNVEIIRDITSVVDPEEDQDYVTTATEAGYAFISELEAMLSSGEYDDDFIESACENGVIDDPEFNPPASEFNYGSNSIDECGGGDFGGDMPIDEAGSSKISADSLERLIKRTFGNSGVYSLTFDTGDTLDAEWMESHDDGVLFNQKDLWSLSPEEREKLYNLIKSGTHYTDSLNGPDFLNSAKDLNEAGYTDDEDDDYASDDLDLDDRGGASLLDLVKGDRKAGRARKAAAIDTAADPAMDDEPVDTDAPEIDDPDAENVAGTSDPNAEAQPGLSAQVKYNPNTVEMMMDDQELDQYLSGFRRPQVAVNVLNRAIRTAQDEVNDSIGLNHLYIVLENGFYVTSRTERGQVIAKVSADQEWRKKNFGED